MSNADIEQVVREKQQLRDSIKASAERLEQLRATKWDLDIQIGKLTLKVGFELFLSWFQVFFFSIF